MKIEVKNFQNQPVRELELPESVFGYPYNEHLIHLVVEAIRAAGRRGTHKTKNRKDVSGGGRKPWRQKGTGRSRHGSIRSPLWIGGGKAHGPNKERDYSQKVNKKMRRAALVSVLSKKLRDSEVKFFESLAVAAPKTKMVSEMLRGLLNIKKSTKRLDVLLVRDPENKGLVRAARNLEKTRVISPDSLNVQDLLTYKYIFVESKALPHIQSPK